MNVQICCVVFINKTSYFLCIRFMWKPTPVRVPDATHLILFSLPNQMEIILQTSLQTPLSS